MSKRRVRIAAVACWAALTGCGGNTATTPPRTKPPATPATVEPAVPDAKADWYVQHHWMHRTPCGNGCVYATHHHSEVTLHLGADGFAQSVDRGETLEETTSAVGGNGRITRWRRQLHGSWSELDGRISITLEPHQLECERVLRDGNKDAPCQPMALKLLCEKAQVQLSEPTAKLTTGWLCLPQQRTRSNELTPLPWVFGNDEWFVALERGNRKHRRGPRRRYAIGDGASYPK